MIATIAWRNNDGSAVEAEVETWHDWALHMHHLSFAARIGRKGSNNGEFDCIVIRGVTSEVRRAYVDYLLTTLYFCFARRLNYRRRRDGL